MENYKRGFTLMRFISNVVGIGTNFSVGFITLLLNIPPASSATLLPVTSADSAPLKVFTPDLTLLTSMSKAQRRSFHLLIENYPRCFYTHLEDLASVASALPIEYSLTFYEKHDAYCGGDPHTMPRRATYYLDKYGRIFIDNTMEATLDLQYQFAETGVLVEDIIQFNHPTHSVFKKYQVRLNKVEKRAKNTFVIFYTSNLPLINKDELFKELLVANGGWDYMIRTETGEEYYIEGDKRKIIEITSYISE